MSEHLNIPVAETNMRCGVEIVRNTSEQRDEYLEHLQSLVKQMNTCCGSENWVIVGSNARDGYLSNQDFSVMNPHGFWRDVDIIVGEKGKKGFDQFLSKYNGPLDVGGRALSSCITIPENGPVILKYGKIKESTSRNLFEPTSLNLGGIQFNSVPIQTLFHLYSIGDRPEGKMRQKDFLNSLDIARYIVKNADKLPFDEEEYQPFHTFARRKNVHQELGLSHKLRTMIIQYRLSRMYQTLPLNNPLIRGCIQHTWDLLCSFENRAS